MKQIPLTQGYVALVDDEDFDKVSAYSWSVHFANSGTLYAQARVPRIQGIVVCMHRLILLDKPGYEVDHKDRDGLNNQKSNLRYATHAQNVANSKFFSSGDSKFRGVHFHAGKWQARIGEERRSLGHYLSEEEAARVYDKAALVRYGEFARLNFP